MVLKRTAGTTPVNSNKPQGTERLNVKTLDDSKIPREAGGVVPVEFDPAGSNRNDRITVPEKIDTKALRVEGRITTTRQTMYSRLRADPIPECMDNHGHVYTKQFNGITELYYMDDHCNATRLTGGGSIAHSLNQAYNDGTFISLTLGPVRLNAVFPGNNDGIQVDGNVVFDEQSVDPGFLANQGKIYTKDVAGITELFYIDSAGNVTQITGAGTLTHSLDQAYDDGRIITVDSGPVDFDGSGVVGNTDVAQIQGNILFDEQAGDPSSAANQGHVYAKDVAGITELFYIDSAGNVTQITGAGTLTHSLQDAYDDGTTINTTLALGAIVFDNAVADASNTLEVTRTNALAGASGILVTMPAVYGANYNAIEVSGGGRSLVVCDDTHVLLLTGSATHTPVMRLENATNPSTQDKTMLQLENEIDSTTSNDDVYGLEVIQYENAGSSGNNIWGIVTRLTQESGSDSEFINHYLSIQGLDDQGTMSKGIDIASEKELDHADAEFYGIYQDMSGTTLTNFSNYAGYFAELGGLLGTGGGEVNGLWIQGDDGDAKLQTDDGGILTMGMFSTPNYIVRIGTPTEGIQIDVSGGTWGIDLVNGGSPANSRIDGAWNFVEQAGDPANIANSGFVYTKDVSGITELFYIDSAGAVTQITGNGSLIHSLQAAYNDGNTINTAGGNAVDITVPNTSNNPAIIVVQNDITNNPNGVEITQNGSGYAIFSTGGDIYNQNAQYLADDDVIAYSFVNAQTTGLERRTVGIAQELSVRVGGSVRQAFDVTGYAGFGDYSAQNPDTWLEVDPPANSVAVQSVYFRVKNTNALTVTGSPATQYFSVYDIPNISVNGGQTIGTSATVYIDGAPNNVGAGAITNTYSLLVNAGNARFGGGVVIDGNLTVKGTTTTIESETVLIGDNHIYLNDGYTTAVAETGGLVVNFLPTATVDTVNGGFTAGVPAVSNPTVITTGGATFAVGDFIQISNADKEENNGLFEVLTHVANVLTIRGVGLTGTVEDFTQNQFVTDAVVAGNITKVNISVIRAGTDGLWEVGQGSNTPITFTDLAFAPPGGFVTLDFAYDGGGAGLGRIITGDSGAVVINNAVVDATNALELNRTGVNHVGSALAVTASGGLTQGVIYTLDDATTGVVANITGSATAYDMNHSLSTGAGWNGLDFDATIGAGVSINNTYRGISSTITYSGSVASDLLIAVEGIFAVTGGGSVVADAVSFYASASQSVSGSITQYYGVFTNVPTGTVNQIGGHFQGDVCAVQVGPGVITAPPTVNGRWFEDGDMVLNGSAMSSNEVFRVIASEQVGVLIDATWSGSGGAEYALDINVSDSNSNSHGYINFRGTYTGTASFLLHNLYSPTINGASAPFVFAPYFTDPTIGGLGVVEWYNYDSRGTVNSNVTSYVGFHSGPLTVNGGATITRAYGIFVEDFTGAGAVTNEIGGFFQGGTSAIQVGTGTPSAPVIAGSWFEDGDVVLHGSAMVGTEFVLLNMDATSDGILIDNDTTDITDDKNLITADLGLQLGSGGVDTVRGIYVDANDAGGSGVNMSSMLSFVSSITGASGSALESVGFLAEIDGTFDTSPAGNVPVHAFRVNMDSITSADADIEVSGFFADMNSPNMNSFATIYGLHLIMPDDATPTNNPIYGINVVMPVAFSGSDMIGGHFTGSGDTADLCDGTYAGNFTGDVLITGKLTVTGAIDPTALYLSRQGADPGLLGTDGIVYTKLDGTSGQTELFYSDDAGNIYQLTVGGINPSQAMADMQEPTGFENRTDSQFSFVDSTRTFTIQPTGADYKFYNAGVETVKSGADNIVIGAVTGSHFIYFDNTGTIQETTTYNDNLLLGDNALIAIIYWDGSRAIFLADERHGINMDGATHLYLHDIVGAAWNNGLALGNFTIDGTGNVDSNTQFDSTDGEIHDEDNIFDITDGNPQDLTPILQAPVYYKEGASPGVWKKSWNDDTWQATTAYIVGDRITNGNFIYEVTVAGTTGGAPPAFPTTIGNTVVDGTVTWICRFYKLSPVMSAIGGSNRLAYNQLSGGNWVQTEVPSSDFVLCHIFAVNDVDNPLIGIQGENVYNTITAARLGAETEIQQLSTTGLGIVEFTAIGTIIFECRNSYTNTLQARIRTTDTGLNYIDWRGSSISQSSGASDHGNLAGLANDDHPGYEFYTSRQSIPTIVTTDATTQTGASYTMSDNTAIHAEAKVTCMESDGSDRCMFHFEGLFYRDGAGALQQGSTNNITVIRSDASITCVFDVNGNDVRVRITGKVGETWNWETKLMVDEVS